VLDVAVTHRCGALWHQYRSPCCALRWRIWQGYAPLELLAVTESVCLGIHHGGAACKAHRPGGANAQNEPGKGDIRPRMVRGLGKKARQFLNEQKTACRRRPFHVGTACLPLGYCETGCPVVERRIKMQVVAEETSDGICDRPFGSRHEVQNLPVAETLLKF
jgi:hypothetical protein